MLGLPQAPLCAAGEGLTDARAGRDSRPRWRPPGWATICGVAGRPAGACKRGSAAGSLSEALYFLIFPHVRALGEKTFALSTVSFAVCLWFGNVWLHFPRHTAYVGRFCSPPQSECCVHVCGFSRACGTGRWGGAWGQRARAGPQDVCGGGCHHPAWAWLSSSRARFWKPWRGAGPGFPLALTICSWRPSRGAPPTPGRRCLLCQQLSVSQQWRSQREFPAQTQMVGACYALF